jgi:hypothetical protein
MAARRRPRKGPERRRQGDGKPIPREAPKSIAPAVRPDPVEQAGLESFPASDPPSWAP